MLPHPTGLSQFGFEKGAYIRMMRNFGTCLDQSIDRILSVRERSIHAFASTRLQIALQAFKIWDVESLRSEAHT
jgi:hypothetical protein